MSVYYVSKDKKLKANSPTGVGTGGGASPEWNEEDAVDNIELLQDTGHAGGCELRVPGKMSHWVGTGRLGRGPPSSVPDTP